LTYTTAGGLKKQAEHLMISNYNVKMKRSVDPKYLFVKDNGQTSRCRSVNRKLYKKVSIYIYIYIYIYDNFLHAAPHLQTHTEHSYMHTYSFCFKNLSVPGARCGIKKNTKHNKIVFNQIM